MRILFALPGLHKYHRGAEVAFISIGRELCKLGAAVTLIGSGKPEPGEPYTFVHCPSVAREHFERFPKLPIVRNEYAYEDLTFSVGLFRRYRPSDFDVTVTCNYPFTNWALQRSRGLSQRSRHVFVTENGDWPAQSTSAEYRFFSCDGLVCTNPDFFDRNKGRWTSRLIPNGIDIARFSTVGIAESGRKGSFVVLMVSALIPSKRVIDGIKAVSSLPNAHLIVAGDGPLRSEVDQLGYQTLGARYSRVTVAANEMPALYRSADVFMHLSREESFGNVFLEALASGLPIVAHDSSRVRWIVGDDECLVDTENLHAVSQALQEAYTTQSASLAAARRSRAALFSWDRIAIQYYDFFNLLLHDSSSAKGGAKDQTSSSGNASCDFSWL